LVTLLRMIIIAPLRIGFLADNFLADNFLVDSFLVDNLVESLVDNENLIPEKILCPKCNITR